MNVTYQRGLNGNRLVHIIYIYVLRLIFLFQGHRGEYTALNLWPLVASDILVQLGQWDGTRDIVCGVSYCRRARTLAWASARAKRSEAPRCWRITLTDIWGFQRRDRICVPTVCVRDRKRERIASKCASPSFHFLPPSLNRNEWMI